jgi:hypothetical protein
MDCPLSLPIINVPPGIRTIPLGGLPSSTCPYTIITKNSKSVETRDLNMVNAILEFGEEVIKF